MIERSIPIRLDDNPRYAGSIHDDAVARRMGYRAALVPGAFLYGHFSRLAVDLWGMDWISRGAIGIRFRRAVYNGDTVLLSARPLPDADGARLALSMTGAEGEEVAIGWIALPATAPAAPAASACPLLPLPDPRPVIAAGGLRPGMRGGTAQEILTRAEIADSLRAFGEDHPLYEGGGLAHSGCLMRKAMFELNRSFALPGPYVLTACEGRHFGAARAGGRFAGSSVITAVHERKGRHYFETHETVLIDNVAVAEFHRVQIYAASE